MENIYKWNQKYWKELKTFWQNDKLLILSNFPFSHNVIKIRQLQMRQNASSSGKRVIEQYIYMSRSARKQTLWAMRKVSTWINLNRLTRTETLRLLWIFLFQESLLYTPMKRNVSARISLRGLYRRGHGSVDSTCPWSCRKAVVKGSWVINSAAYCAYR